MTQSNKVYVIAMNKAMIKQFWDLNGDRTHILVPISTHWPIAEVELRASVWILGTVDNLMAETINYLVTVRKVTLKYADCDEKVLGIHG